MRGSTATLAGAPKFGKSDGIVHPGELKDSGPRVKTISVALSTG
jgi:hypothetical protein